MSLLPLHGPARRREVTGPWDIGKVGFDQYIGNYTLRGKSVLDVGTASGYLAFSAERAGASRVTALEMESSREVCLIPFQGNADGSDRSNWDMGYEASCLNRLKSSFWYAWHKFNSGVEALYAPIGALPYCTKKFDVVIAGALIEHISDPVTAIGNMARLAREAVIIAFTPVEESDKQFMQTTNKWDNSSFNYTWWTLSKGLYRRVFDNLGFDAEFKESFAIYHPSPDLEVSVSRPTIIATRRV